MKKADTLRELPGRFIALCAAAFALCMLAASVSALRGVSAKSALGLALSLAAFALAAFSAYLAARRLPERALPALVVLAALLVRAPFALLPDAEQVSDFALLYDSAAALAGGDASALSGEYFLHWGYQVPFVLYEALVIRLGGGVGALRVLNLLWTAGASGLVYLFALKFAGPRGLCRGAALRRVPRRAHPGRRAHEPAHLALLLPARNVAHRGAWAICGGRHAREPGALWRGGGA